MGCVGAPAANGTPCDDGHFCTVGDVCQDGACGGRPRDCSGQVSVGDDRCQQAQCDEKQGSCVVKNLVGALCDDDNECTSASACKPFAGSTSDCSPTGGSCSCVATANFTDNRACDDKNPCTTQSRCTTFDFSSSPCSATGSNCACHPVANDTTGAACDDNNPCSITSTCQDSFGDNCFSTGTCTCAATLNDTSGASCDDGDACTTTSACSGFGCGSTSGTCTCSGFPDRDADGDLFVDSACGGTDCDDADPNVNPSADEGPGSDLTCSDGKDNDCDGAIDSADQFGITNCSL
jgi:hypothetical protein